MYHSTAVIQGSMAVDKGFLSDSELVSFSWTLSGEVCSTSVISSSMGYGNSCC
jgi:hypothetical protein